MGRKSPLIFIVVAAIAALIVWQFGFQKVWHSEKTDSHDAKTIAETSSLDTKDAALVAPEKRTDVKEVHKSPDPNTTQSDLVALGAADKTAQQKPPRREKTTVSDSAAPEDPNGQDDSLEAINLNNTEMKFIVGKMAEWTGKTIIPDDQAMKQKITIYAPRRLPKAKALEKIYSALRIKGYVVESSEDTIYIKPITDARLGLVPTIPLEQPLAAIENKEQVVQRFFRLSAYSPTQMAQIVQPLIDEYGYLSADETAGTLLVIDTVASLMRIETIITQFDIAQTAETVTEIFEVYHRDPKELVPLLQALLDKGIQSKPAAGAPKAPAPSPVASTHNKSKDGKPVAAASATSIAVGSGPRALTLLAEPRYNWIIAKGSVEDVNEVRTWIEKLDKAVPTIMAADSLETIANKNQIVQRFIKLQKSSPSQMIEIVRPLMSPSGYVTADEDARSLLLIDTVESLLRVEPVIARFDADQADGSVVEVFEIRHREPEEIVQLLETLFVGAQPGNSGPRSSSNQPNWPPSKDGSPRHGQSKQRSASRDGLAASVIVGTTGRPMSLVPVARNKWIIARASPEDIRQIGQWIQRLDASFPTILAGDSLADMENKNQVVQRFIELRNYNPTRMAEIVGPLMGESGYVSGDEATGSLLVIDTVENLLRIEPVIAHFDVNESEHTEAKVFEIHHRQPDEIIRLLDTLLGNEMSPTGAGRNNMSRSSHSSGKSSWQTGQSGSTPRNRDAGAPAAIIGANGRAIVLISDPEQKLIIAKASPEDILQIDQWIQRLDRPVPTLACDEPLADIEDKNQVVQKCIKLQSFSPGRMADIVLPLLSESGYVSADEMTGNLLLIDTVQNLMRIEAVVAQFDVPEAEGTVTEILEVAHGDPSEIVQLVRMLLGEGNSRSMPSYGSGARYGGSSRRPYTGSGLYRSGSGASGNNSMLVGPSQMPVVLIPESKRKWIIARASAQDMKAIREWVTKLDQKEQSEREYEAISIIYADPREVATQLNQALQQMPGTELEASVLVQPLDQAKQIVVFGRSDLREMVKKLIEEIDVPPGQFLTEHFKLKYADPDVIERNITDLYGESRLMSSRRPPGQTGTNVSPDTVKVISHLSLKEVTVIASPGNMDKIKQQIEDWDVQIDVNEVKPRIIELHNSDTVQMRDLLTTLFSREAASSRFSVYDYLFGFGHEDKEKIIGPLYGQITFEEVPGTKKIIVVSNIPGAYAIVEDLVRRLDQQEMAEVPKVIKLQYRNPETLAESLNAMFNETGTSASIRLSEQGLSDYSMDDPQGANVNNDNRSTSSTNSVASRGPSLGAEYRPWWTTGRSTVGQMPISNVIGRARFIPDRYSNSILALVPPEFLENITQMIRELDTPGKQVMIKAIIVQIDHSNMTSLGIQLSSDQTRWATLDNENSVTARNVLGLLEKHGALVFGAGGDAGSRSEVTVSADVTLLIDFLIKELNAKILNQQTLWTKDNEEAEFFKGQRVGFQTRVSISDTGGRATSDYEYEKVGMTLRTRPSITPEKNVDMVINVVLSQLTPEEINNQRVRTEMDTTTNMIVKDGQTLMLGGMLFDENSNVQRKLPLLGDLPLVGGLFRHNEGVIANSELLIFVTPYVVDGLEETLPETLREIEQPRERLRDVQQQLRGTRPESTPSTSEEEAGQENQQ